MRRFNGFTSICSKIRLATVKTLAIAALVSGTLASAQTLTVLHTFNGTDGIFPNAPLLRDASGTLYGTTSSGGVAGDGTVFKLDRSGNFTTLYQFTGPDGMWPGGALILDSAGSLYGTTELGGANNGGVVFKVDSAGNETTLYTFGASATDGRQPLSGLIRDASGNLYGTTEVGGTGGAGTLFKLDGAGAETILHNFVGSSPDGQYPSGNMVLVQNRFYGTTSFGGASDMGTAFVVTTSGKEEVLFSFGGTTGESAYGGLVRGAGGYLYGASEFGGDLTCNAVSSGCGTVYKLDTKGNQTVLYSFLGVPDGDAPVDRLVSDQSGNLYGVTMYGGTGGCHPSPAKGCGIIFMIDPSGVETVLYEFPGKSQGNYPAGGLIRDAQGNFYGTTAEGGSGCNGEGCGVIFKFKP